jgi:hypothetical protein
VRRVHWLLLAGILFTAPYTSAEESAVMSEENLLRQQLKAERAINEQLRRRVEELNQQLKASGEVEKDPTSLVGWDAEPEMAQMPQIKDFRSALDEALVVRELVLLAPGVFQFNPSFSWAHDGSGDKRRDSYIIVAELQAGLPLNFAASLRVPYVKRDYAIGSNDGIGDISFGLRRKLNKETNILPSLVARIDYTHDTGSDAFRPVAVSSGFRSIAGGISLLKRLDPVAMSGIITYNHAFEQSVTSINIGEGQLFKGQIERGDLLTLGLKISLAATPDISMDAGLTLFFQDRTRFSDDEDTAFRSPSTQAGYINIGFGAILTRKTYLLFSTAGGITDDAVDSILSVSLTYRF